MGNWTIVSVPFDTQNVFGTRRAVRVKGRIDECFFDDISLMPLGDGTHFLTVRNELRKKIGKKAGDKVSIELEQDNAKIKVPGELTEALQASEEASQFFAAMSESQQRFLIRAICTSRVTETRIKRAVRTVLELERLYFEKGLPKKRSK